MSRLILYGITLLCVGGAMPYVTNVPDLRQATDSEYIKQIMRKAKAAEILSFMNKSVDPCDDFYEFSCGNWPVINKASREELSTGIFERLSDGLDRKLKILLNNVDEMRALHIEKLVRNFYKSCLRIEKIDKPLQQKYKSIIEEFGTMPVLQGDNWSETSFDWVETVSKIYFHYGLKILTGVEVSADFANNKLNVVYFSEQNFPLETRSVYLSNHTAPYRQLYSQRMASNLHKFLGVEKSLASDTASKLMAFEVELARGLSKETESPNLADINKLMTLTQLQRLYAPDIDVERLVNGSLGERVDRIYNYNHEYHENLIRVLRRTPKQVVANYIFYSLISDFFFTPGKTKANKEKQCIAETKTHFAKILDNLVFRNYDNNSTSNDIKTTWSKLKAVFKEKLQSDNSLNWINNQTRSSAIGKLDSMTLQINSYDLKELSEEYKNLYTNDADFMLNLRRIHEHTGLQNRDQLHKPVKPLDEAEDLSFTPANILAENTIKIPVALLQPFYLWAVNYPSAIMFGTLASLIGHELMHGFDSDGRDYDAEGNVHTWWDDKSTANFVERQNCFKEQYSRYVYNGFYLPMSDDQAENIADNGGLRLGYAAYRRWLQVQQESGKLLDIERTERLPSLDYSNTQLFFISFGQMWCSDVLPETRSFNVASDEHVPNKFRLIGSLSNFDEFAKEFNCQRGTQMNPIEKCQIY